MSVIIGPYAHDFFQSLPTLEEAKANFTKANGQDLVSNRLKDLFVEADMDRRFGLTLLHRHFDLASNEKLVEYGGTCSPWEKGAVELGPLQPAIWAFDNNGNLKPTEFRYSSEQDAPLSVKELAFAARLKSELETRGLVKLFGLSRYPGDGFQGSCEFTQDRVNINLNPKDDDSIPEGWLPLILIGSSRSLYGRADVAALAMPVQKTTLMGFMFIHVAMIDPEE